MAAPAKPAYESTFTPLTALPAQVKAPSVKQTAAFAALNALLSAETRFSEDVIGMSVSLQRAQAADAAGAQLWYLRQTNASAEYAGFAAGLVSRFPALQTAMARSVRGRQDEPDPQSCAGGGSQSEAPERPARRASRRCSRWLRHPTSTPAPPRRPR